MDWKGRWEAAKDAVWALLMPFILLGGILSGIFTPTEASIVTCAYALIVGVFVYKEIKSQMFQGLYGKTCVPARVLSF